MIRVLLAVLAMFFLPFFIYAAYKYVKDRGDVQEGFLQGAPVNWLLIIGTILAVGTLAKLVSTDILEYEGQQSAPAKTSGAQTPGRSP
jgi:TRAP-type C4-dicarboxylate transport system permease small subunit